MLRLRRPLTVGLRCDEACVGTAELRLDPAIARRLDDEGVRDAKAPIARFSADEIKREIA